MFVLPCGNSPEDYFVFFWSVTEGEGARTLYEAKPFQDVREPRGRGEGEEQGSGEEERYGHAGRKRSWEGRVTPANMEGERSALRGRLR